MPRLIALNAFSLNPANVSGLLSWYKLDEGSGTVLGDSGGNAYHGETRVTGAHSPTGGNWSDAVTWTGQGISFDGSTQGAWIPPEALETAKTVMLFCSTAPRANSQSVLFWYGNISPYNAYAFALSELDGRPILDSTGYGDSVPGGSAVPIYSGSASLAWTFAGGIGTAAVSGANKPKCYVNGAETARYFEVGSGDAHSVDPSDIYLSYLGCSYPHFLPFTGTIYTVLTFSRVLTAGEVRGVHNYVKTVLAGRGVTLGVTSTLDSSKKLIAFDGDSIARGYSTNFAALAGGKTGAANFLSLMQQTRALLGGSYNWINCAHGGQTAQDILARGAGYYDGLLSGFTQNAVLVVMVGTNDGFGYPGQSFTDLLAYCAARKSAGYDHVVVCTGLPRFSGNAPFEAARQAWNAQLLAQSSPPWDAVADWGDDPDMGQAAQNTNATYYFDNTHPTARGTPNGYGVGAGYVAAALGTLGYT